MDRIIQKQSESSCQNTLLIAADIRYNRIEKGIFSALMVHSIVISFSLAFPQEDLVPAG
jgi:hypothetical protein